MSRVIAVGNTRAAGVSDGVDSVVGVVGPDGGGAGILFRHVLGLQAAITIIGHRRVLISATAFRTSVLTNLLDLVAYVVGIHRSRIHGIVWSSPEGSRSVPVEDFGLHGAAED